MTIPTIPFQVPSSNSVPYEWSSGNEIVYLSFQFSLSGYLDSIGIDSDFLREIELFLESVHEIKGHPAGFGYRSIR